MVKFTFSTDAEKAAGVLNYGFGLTKAHTRNRHSGRQGLLGRLHRGHPVGSARAHKTPGGLVHERGVCAPGGPAWGWRRCKSVSTQSKTLGDQLIDATRDLLKDSAKELIRHAIRMVLG